MGKVLLCVGKYAEVPYFFDKALVNVYCMEELCYCLLKYAYLIDKEILDGRLTGWIEKECGLEELSDRLRKLSGKGCGVGEYVEAILCEIGYGGGEQIRQAVEELTTGASQSMYEKKKLRGDYLVESKRYVMALRIYGQLLAELPAQEREFAARVCHNKGVAYAGLFLFSQAAQSFREAYEYDSREESYIQYLTASRLAMNETEYVDFVAGQTEEYELALKVEKIFEKEAADFDSSEQNRMLFTLKVCKDEKNTVSYSYYEEIERITSELKEEYRQIVSD